MSIYAIKNNLKLQLKSSYVMPVYVLKIKSKKVFYIASNDTHKLHF